MRYDERKEAEAYERGLNAGRLEAAKDLAAAEERGRRRGVEERDELRALLIASRPFAADYFKQHDQGINAAKHFDLIVRIDAALAPRDSAPAEENRDVLDVEREP